MARRQVRRRRPLGEDRPDLTPLADCVFLLLIFFMLTTVFIVTKGLSVDLPRAPTTQARVGQDINLIIESDGTMELNGEPVTMVQLGERLKQAREALSTKDMLLQAHPKTLHKVVVRVIDVARGEGIEGIAFAREIKE